MDATLSPLALDPIAVLAGYLYAVVVGGWAVPRVTSRIRPRYGPFGPWHRTALSLLERIVTATAVLLLAPELVAGWLVLKAAGSWGGWSTQPGVFNRFLVGTGVSMLFGAGGGALAWAWSLNELWLAAAAAGGPIIVAGLVLSFYWPRKENFWTKFWRVPIYDGPDEIDLAAELPNTHR